MHFQDLPKDRALPYLGQVRSVATGDPAGLLKSELRHGWLGFSEQYELFDALGAGLGAFFLWQAVSGKHLRWASAVLGGIMIYIHTQRFFYAPETKSGLIRLLKSLDITSEELESIQYQLRQ